jgi:hypothetical protein
MIVLGGLFRGCYVPCCALARVDETCSGIRVVCIEFHSAPAATVKLDLV